jgi:cell division protein FtsI (penicillin-binding protein 3)
VEEQADSPIVRRVRWVIGSFFVLAFILVAQLFRWQVLARSQVIAPSEPTPSVRADAARGVVVDPRGYPYAVEDFRWEVYASPKQINGTPGLAAEMAATLSSILRQDEADLFAKLSGDANSVLLERNANWLMKQAIAEKNYERRLLWLDPVRERFYPQGRLGAHLIGFVNSSRSGFYGVEGFYDPFLRLGIIPLDLRGKPGHEMPRGLHVPSPAGHDVILAVDRSVQFIVEEELRNGIINYNAESGTIIVLDPRTGTILAMASYPSYDPNRRYQSDEPYFQNPAIGSVYEPGSAFKIITIASALDAGAVTPQTRVDDTGELMVGGRKIQNSDRKAYGQVTVTEILARSLNVGAARVAQEMGKEAFYAAVRRFGFGSPTGVDLDGEVAGLVKLPGEAAWSESDLVTNAFGQGVAVTPLQLAMAVAAVANEGELMRPHVAEAIVVKDQLVPVAPFPVRQVIRPETARLFTKILLEATETAAGGPLVPGYHFAGKTGTAEIPGQGAYLANLTIVTFVGYGPVEDPRFVILVKLDKPKKSPWAQEVALPVFQRVAQRLLTLMDIAPGN